MNKSIPWASSMSGSWSRASSEFEWMIALLLSSDHPHFMKEWIPSLQVLVGLARRIGATHYGRRYRAGTGLRSTLKISTAAQHGLKHDETYIEVTAERLEHGDYGFVIHYFEGGYASDALCALRESYDTEDSRVIEANLRRDMPGYCYPCEHEDAWATLKPLLVRLWNETHSPESSLETESDKVGKDIRGWVEIQRRWEGLKPPHNMQWYGAIKIDSLLSRNYDMFGALFGVTTTPFAPIMPDRGLPQDVSEETGDDYLDWGTVLGESWISWAELQQIDWDETAVDHRPHAYVPDETGQLAFKQRADPCPTDPTEVGSVWQVGESVFKRETVTRRDAMEQEWPLLFRLMEDLAAEYGPDGVRLVVWFDY